MRTSVKNTENHKVGKTVTDNTIQFNLNFKDGPVDVTPKPGEQWTREDVLSHFETGGYKAKSYLRTRVATLILCDRHLDATAKMSNELFDELKLSEVLEEGLPQN